MTTQSVRSGVAPDDDRLPIFRREALEHANDRYAGELPVSMPVGFWAAGVVAIVCAAVIIAFLVSNQYTRRISAAGSITLFPEPVPVSSLKEARIASVMVHDNQYVAAGQPIAVLTTAVSSARSTDVEQQIAAVGVEARSLEIADRDQELASRRDLDGLSQRLLKVNATLKTLAVSESLQKRRVALARETLDRFIELERQGLVPTNARIQREDDYLAQEQQLQSVRQNLSELENQRLQIDGERIKTISSVQNRHDDLQRQIAALTPRAVELQTARASSLTAPVSGTLLRVHLAVGDIVSPQQELATILPRGSKLQAELWVSGEAAGITKVGQRVLLRVDGFPYDHYGFQRGSVSAISAASLRDTNADDGDAKAPRAKQFRVTVKLDRPYVESEGIRYALRPGMHASGEVLLERKKLIDWLLGPTSSVVKALREH
jgi:membrane fusion protein